MNIVDISQQTPKMQYGYGAEVLSGNPVQFVCSGLQSKHGGALWQTVWKRTWSFLNTIKDLFMQITLMNSISAIFWQSISYFKQMFKVCDLLIFIDVLLVFFSDFI